VAISDARFETLLVEQFDRVARLTLNRPEKRNALSQQAQAELIAAVEGCAEDETVHAVVIRGAGRSFSSGYDISSAGDGAAGSPSIPHLAMSTLALARGWGRIWNAPIMVIAQIHGHCLAGATDLAQHCDLIIAADDATIGFPAVRMGGTPPTNMWLYNAGPQWAKRLLCTGDTFTGRLAAQIGFALESVPAEELDDRVMALARRIAAVGREIVAINKLVINTGLDLMGRAALQQYSGPMDAIANYASERAVFNATAQEIGLRAAFEQRDAPFVDGVPLDTSDR
jgi:enoyl-CoA hydratase